MVVYQQLQPETSEVAKGFDMADNTLYYGDNLEIMRRYIQDETVDLVYLDPPFNSNATYNVLFNEKDDTQAASQIKAFEDTWRWDHIAAAAYQDTVEMGGQVSRVMQAFRTVLSENTTLAYLAMMAPRLVEMRRVMKPTASIYLHCDPTASHYLKMLMDAVFGPTQFRNEIIWKRTGSHGGAKRWGPVHDTLLFYSKGQDYVWNKVFEKYEDSYLDNYYRFEDERGKYRLVTLTGAGTRTGDSGKPWRGVDPTASGRHWAVPSGALREVAEGMDTSSLTTQQKLDLLDEKDLIYWPERGSIPQQKRYINEAPGVQIQDIITDIRPISSQAAERLGFPTQKPLALLERIINASSKPGDVVLDPFCGCGTAVHAAQKLGRQWIGIDITYIAVAHIKRRLRNAYWPSWTDQQWKKLPFRVIGEPVSLPDAQELATSEPYQFQWWALDLVNARPTEEKKGADKGIDGRLYFHDDKNGVKTKQIIFSVKAGHTNVTHLRDLRGVLDREGADIGVLITMEEPTKPMRTEAASAGFYESGWGTRHPRLQLLTIAELLDNRTLDIPTTRGNVTFKKAERVKKNEKTPRLEESSE